MTLRDILKVFFFKVLLPAPLFAAAIDLMIKAFTPGPNSSFYFMMLLLCGFPFGFSRLRLLIIPGRGCDLGTSGALFVLGIMLSGLVGVFVMAWRLMIAIGYLLLTVGRTVKYVSASKESHVSS